MINFPEKDPYCLVGSAGARKHSIDRRGPVVADEASGGDLKSCIVRQDRCLVLNRLPDIWVESLLPSRPDMLDHGRGSSRFSWPQDIGVLGRPAMGALGLRTARIARSNRDCKRSTDQKAS